MKIVSARELRANLKETLDQICDEKDIAVMKRRKNKDVVIMPLEMFNELNRQK